MNLNYWDAMSTIVANGRFVKRESRFSENIAFYVDNKELLHFHGKSEIDIRLGRSNIRSYLATRDSLNNSCQVRRDWIAFPLKELSENDLRLLISEYLLRDR